MAVRARVLIVVFDALRPDLVSTQSMPALCAFADEGVRFSRSRSTFPTETRVNQSALVTGCYPQRHGIVGNHFVDRSVSPATLLNTGDEDALRTASERLGGDLLGVPSLGEQLYANGCTLATISAGTPGGGRLIHHTAERTGGFRLALARPDAIVSSTPLDALTTKVGAIPSAAIPSTDWINWTTDLYLSYIEPELAPDVTILWFSEPDNSYHRYGVGSAQSLQAMSAADAAFARILAGCQDHSSLQIITLSDHGQLSAPDEALDINQALRDAGFNVDDRSQPGFMTVSLDTAGGVYLEQPAPDLVEALVAFFASQPWCAVVSTHNGVGVSLAHSQLLFDHARAPDVGVVLAADDSAGPFAVAGTTQHASKYAGGGVHGGLSQFELHNWLAMAGNRLRTQTECSAAAGIVDVLPTVMTLLDLPTPAHVQGRPLSEAFVSGPGSPQSIREDVPIRTLHNQSLHRGWVGHTPYLHALKAT